MTDNPIESVVIDGTAVGKASVRSWAKARVPQVMANAAEVNNTNLVGQLVIKLKSTGRDYAIDTSDTTTADDGVNCLVSLDGYRFKICKVVGLDGISGASALTRIRVVATADVAIASALKNGDSLNGVTLTTNDLVLLTSQSTTYQNGVYVVQASGAAVRHPDFNAYDELPGSYFSVMEGTVNADTLWQCTSNKGGTIGSTALAFAQFFQSSSKVVTFTRDMSLASGSQSITGVGFHPRLVQFQTAIQGGSAWVSFGQADASAASATEFSMGGASAFYQPSIAGIQRDSGSTYNTFVVASFDADGFTLTWTKTGNPTATARVTAICFR
jgi:hypothetical protein